MRLRRLLLLAVLGALPLRIPDIPEPALLPGLLVLQLVVVRLHLLHLLLHRLPLHLVPLGLRGGPPTTHFLPTITILPIRQHGHCEESVWFSQRREPPASHASHASPA